MYVMYIQQRKMQQIQSVPGKLFYVVYHMHKENTIDGRGKQILKDLIIMSNAQITKAYEQYLRNGTELTLKNDLFRIYKLERDLERAEGLSDRSRKSKGLKSSITIKVPPKNIQKVPAHLREI